MDEYAKAAIDQAIAAGTLDTDQLAKFVPQEALPSDIQQMIAAMQEQGQ